MPNPTKAYAADSADQPLGAREISRRDVGDRDVQIEILYCGVCHSDIHQARNEWHNTVYPCVPGHEIVGRVTRVGPGVSRFKVNDTAAVGCLVDSCGRCGSCNDHLEQHCEEGPVFTYNSPVKQTGPVTYGGYSRSIVVDEDFVLSVAPQLDPAAAAPLLCAGITTYSPLKRFGIGRGSRVAVVGLGGLGHMGVKFAAAFGAQVTVFTGSRSKHPDARRLGAHEVVDTTDAGSLSKHANRFDFVLDTVSADHDINACLGLLKRSGEMVLVGAPEKPLPVAAFSLILQRRTLAGSLIGGIQETQEMLDFCAQRSIVCDIELIRMDQINEAFERMLNSDVRYRFVVDIKTLS